MIKSIARLLRAAIPKRFRPIGYLEHLVMTKTGGRVKDGPFAGMRYLKDAVGSAYVPKVLGIYERELNGCVEEACAMNPSLIVDVGAAEGYYAVGMALRNPAAQVVAFEMEAKGRGLIEELANINQVGDRVTIRGRCEPEDLKSALGTEGPVLIICDVEGYEEVLLNSDAIPHLRECHILVEMHDFISEGITERVTEGLARSHQIDRIWQEPRSRDDMPFRTLGTALLPTRYLDWAVSEWRPVRMSWLWARPKHHHPAANG